MPGMISYHPIGDAEPSYLPSAPNPTDTNSFDTRADAFLRALPTVAARPVCDYCKTPYLTARPVGCRHCGAPAK